MNSDTYIDSLGAKSATIAIQSKGIIETWLSKISSLAIFNDINATYAKPLRYNDLDSLAVRLLWLHGIVLAALLTINSYIGVPNYFPSPIGWRVISPTGGLLALLVGILTFIFPLVIQRYSQNHYLWRIALSLSLAIFSYLFIFASGGATIMHFHMLLVMAIVATYADWRLEWLLLAFFGLFSFILDVFLPHWMFTYGYNLMSVPIDMLFLLLMTYFTTTLCKNHRLSIENLVLTMQRNDQFLAIAAHELRTPLTSVKGYVDILERKLRRSSQTELLAYTEKLDGQVTKLTGLVRDLLDVSKIQAGQVAMHQERLSINSVVAQSVEEVQALAHHHKIIVAGWANTPVLGDPVRLCQVMVNLLSNAMKYSPASDRVMVRVSETRDKVIISVQDFGIGISTTERLSIFEPYFRSQNAERGDVPGGLGMGLYVAAEIVNRHGGRIWLDSQEGSGSTFSFLLPLMSKEQPAISSLKPKEVARA